MAQSQGKISCALLQDVLAVDKPPSKDARTCENIYAGFTMENVMESREMLGYEKRKNLSRAE